MTKYDIALIIALKIAVAIMLIKLIDETGDVWTVSAILMNLAVIEVIKTLEDKK